MSFRSRPEYARPEAKRRSPAMRILFFSFVVGMIGVPVAFGALLYYTFGSAANVMSAPQLAPSSVEMPSWAGRGRETFLLLGTDHRDGDVDLPRTDVMMVASFDPQMHSAAIISLPRDIWLDIPGHGKERINAAFEFGELEKPGGGPALARKVVEQLLGVPIQHYALIGFGGFEKMIDLAGGVTVDVERPLKDNEYPDKDYSVRRIFFQPGLQHLDGVTALWYVRSRHSDSDFGRARRQQQLLLSLRHQALQLNLLPKLPSMVSALSESVKTDLRPQELVSLARAAKDIDAARVVNRVIDETMTTNFTTPAGEQVLLVNKNAVQALVKEAFSTP